MLRIRLRRTGKKKQPQYRLVVADQRAPRNGKFVEIVGHYNPRTTPKALVVKEERIKYWLSLGAKPSETVHRLLHKEGLIEIDPRKRDTKPSKVEVRAAVEAEAAAAAAEAEAAEAAAATEAAASAEASSADSADDASDSTEEAAEAEAAPADPTEAATDDSTDADADSADKAEAE
ncbi:MAG TPA: 30S ribosomal protein S16 [Dehalococcoidia bacterium]|jgi:small subunit ribosomal protein S16|nr:30S ribosomal protein S16 [Dehalococcoidia bacterium]